MKISLYILAIACSISLNAQETISDLLSLHNTKNIDYISVQELAMPKTNALIFDAREIEEYNVSHIKNAVFVGFNDFEDAICNLNALIGFIKYREISNSECNDWNWIIFGSYS